MMYRNPITKKSHRKWELLHREIGRKIAPAYVGTWDEITSFRDPTSEHEPKSAERRGMSLTVSDSHRILADEIRLNGRCFALNPTMIHTKGQHVPVENLTGWYSIRPARTANAWDFADRIGD